MCDAEIAALNKQEKELASQKFSMYFYEYQEAVQKIRKKRELLIRSASESEQTVPVVQEFCVGLILPHHNDVAVYMADEWIANNKPNEGWKFTGEWHSSGGTSYCKFKKEKKKPVVQDIRSRYVHASGHRVGGGGGTRVYDENDKLYFVCKGTDPGGVACRNSPVMDDRCEGDMAVFNNERVAGTWSGVAVLAVSGMTCTSCTGRIEAHFASFPGVKSVDVQLLVKKVVIQYDAALLSVEKLIREVVALDFSATVIEDGQWICIVESNNEKQNGTFLPMAEGDTDVFYIAATEVIDINGHIVYLDGMTGLPMPTKLNKKALFLVFLLCCFPILMGLLSFFFNKPLTTVDIMQNCQDCDTNYDACYNLGDKCFENGEQSEDECYNVNGERIYVNKRNNVNGSAVVYDVCENPYAKCTADCEWSKESDGAEGAAGASELAYKGVPPAEKWTTNGVHTDCNDPKYYGIGSPTGDIDRSVCLTQLNNGWLQLDLGAVKTVVAVVTTGCVLRVDSTFKFQYVTKYTITVSNNGSTFTNAPCVQKDSNGYCNGNTDHSKENTNILAGSITARFVRLNVKAYNGYASLRMGVYVKI